MNVSERARRLKQARTESGYRSAVEAAEAFSWNRNTCSSNENRNAPSSCKKAKAYGEAFGVSAAWLYADPDAPYERRPCAKPPGRPRHVDPVLSPVIGWIDADVEGALVFAAAQDAGDVVPLPPGGSDRTVALLLKGHAMRGFVDEGGLIYFEDQLKQPTQHLVGHVVVVETSDGEVWIKRLRRGSRPWHCDHESLAGPTTQDCKVRWAAPITAIVPPYQAGKIIQSTMA